MTFPSDRRVKGSVLLLGVAWLVLAVPANSQTNEAYQAALAGLQLLPELLPDPATMAQFGFNSTNELNMSKLGHPLPLHDLSLPTLLAWSPSQSASNLLTEAELAIFPVVAASNDVRTAITVRKNGSKWEAVEFGGGSLVKLYSNTRETNSMITGVPLTEYFALRVRPLQVHFVGYQQTNQFMMVPVVNAPRLGLTNGIPLTAESTLRILAGAAHSMVHYPK